MHGVITGGTKRKASYAAIAILPFVACARVGPLLDASTPDALPVDASIGSDASDADARRGDALVDGGGPADGGSTGPNVWQQVPITTKALRHYLEGQGITPAAGEGMQFVHALTYAPNDARIAFLGVDTDTIWKSEDGGTTWKRKGKGIHANGIVSITVDPTNANRVFVTGAQYRSLWKNATNRAQMPLGIYRTLDGGEHWELVKRTWYGGPNSYQRFGGNLVAFAGSRIVAGTYEDGLIQSTDGGDTWTTILDFATIGRIFHVEAHPADSSVVYVGSEKGLRRVTAGGGVTSIGTGLTGPAVPILIDSRDPRIMFAGDDTNRIMKSTDSGQLFTASFTHSTPTKATSWMGMSPVNPDRVFVSFGTKGYGATEAPKDFYFTDNASAGNVVWQTATSMDEKNQFGWVAGSLSVRFAGDMDSWSEFFGGPIAMHPTDPNTALFFAGPGVIKKTTDGGRNWRYSNAGYTAMAGMAHSLFSWDVENPRGFATNNSDRGIYFTDDNSHTFSSYVTPYWPQQWESRGYGVAVGHGQTGDVIVGALGSHDEQILTVSRDKGATWAQIETPNTAGNWLMKHIEFSPTNANVVYAGAFRSIDGGATWTTLERRVDAVHFGNGDIVYSIGSGASGIHIYKSTNRGSTWSTPYPEIPTPNNNVSHIAVSPTDPDRVYLGKRGVGVYIIQGSAAPIFRNHTNGLLKDRWNTFNFMAITTDPKRDQVVYVGNLTSPFGHDDKTIFRSVDGGMSWDNISYNLDASVNGVGVNPHDGWVYVGTWGGMWKLPPPTR